jgi:co-chaperonin GroES (HSP10)
MQGTAGVSPLRDLVLVERLEGHGIERVTKGGIIIPATTEAHAKTRADTFRAVVLAKGPEAPSELALRDVVILHTWAEGDGSTLYTGVRGLEKHHLFVKPDDIVCIVDDELPPTQPGAA